MDGGMEEWRDRGTRDRGTEGQREGWKCIGKTLSRRKEEKITKEDKLANPVAQIFMAME
jgi:hypothetical protein